MRKLYVIFLVLCFIFSSCIPLRIAPEMKGGKIMMAKKFKRKLPKRHALIFKDPKEANEFYHFINAKYKLNHIDVETNVSFEVEGKKFFLSFYETSKPTKILDLFPVAIGILTQAEDIEYEVFREDHWYLALTVSDEEFQDCLEPIYPNRHQLTKYLRSIRQEYLSTQNYNETLLKY